MVYLLLERVVARFPLPDQQQGADHCGNDQETSRGHPAVCELDEGDAEEGSGAAQDTSRDIVGDTKSGGAEGSREDLG